MVTQALKKNKIRASWKGQLRVGLVVFPVQALNVVSPDAGPVRFHQIHRACHSRVRHQKVCPIHGSVPNDEIVLGYEYGKGKYVEFAPDELNRLRTEEERALSIERFIAPEQLAPIYLDGRAYYLIPDGPESQEPYAVVQTAMERLNRRGFGTVVFAEREQLVLVRPFDGLLLMEMVRHETEIRKPADLDVPMPKTKNAGRKIELAEQLIAAEAGRHFDLAGYRGRHHEEVERLIRAKIEGREKELEAPAATGRPRVINLMDALKQSVARAHVGAPPKPPKLAGDHVRRVRAVARRSKPKGRGGT